MKKSPKGISVACLDRTIEFTPVEPALRTKVLASAVQHEPRWKRQPHALARDNRGIYYYVDKYAAEFGGKHYRVFRGPRGGVKETALVDIVEDSNGMIFSTKSGDLRLLIGSKSDQQALWIHGKKRTSLTSLPSDENRQLIYSGLGVYDNVEIGTICE